MSRYIDADRIDWRMIITPTNPTTTEEYIIYTAKRLVESQPTADVVEVVHGEWLKDAENEIYCSKCGKYTYDRHDEIKEFDGKTVIALCYPRFCGSCGAKMEVTECAKYYRITSSRGF